MLDSATVASVTGLAPSVGQEAKGSSGSGLAAIGHCLWGPPSTGVGVEITAFPETAFKAFFDGTPAMTPMTGVGLAAKGSSTTVSGIAHASLYVDFGTFGLLVAVNSKTATLEMAAALANAIK